MKTKQGEDLMLTRQEAAQYLHCSVSFLEKKATNDPGLIPHIKIGKKALYRKTDLDSYISNKYSNH